MGREDGEASVPALRQPRVLRVVRCELPELHAPTWLAAMRSIAQEHAGGMPGLVALAIGEHARGGTVIGEIITLWDSADALQAAVGGDWDQPVIPAEFLALATSITVEHREVMGLWPGPAWIPDLVDRG